MEWTNIIYFTELWKIACYCFLKKDFWESSSFSLLLLSSSTTRASHFTCVATDLASSIRGAVSRSITQPCILWLCQLSNCMQKERKDESIIKSNNASVLNSFEYPLFQNLYSNSYQLPSCGTTWLKENKTVTVTEPRLCGKATLHNVFCFALLF